MKKTIKTLTTKALLAGSVCLLLVSSCKKAEFAGPKGPHHRAADTTLHDTITITTPHDTIKITISVPVDTTKHAPKPKQDTTCSGVTYDIWDNAAGNDTTKGTKVGSVHYSNDTANLYVTYTFTGATCPTEVNLWVGNFFSMVPSTIKGVDYTQFPYKLSSPSCSTYTFTVPLASPLNGSKNVCGQDVKIVLHAKMNSGDDAVAYGDQSFNGKTWGWATNYTVCCKK